MPTQITSLEQLKKEAQDGCEFFILLNYNLKSSKRIIWDEDRCVFFVNNFIDESEEVLTEKQIMDRNHTNIGYAMTRGALFKDG